MAYPGNSELSPQAQDRVMTAFKQVVGKLQQGNREEALIGLEFVLRLDPAYAPARNLHQQLSSGASEIDLNDILGQLQAPTTDTINTLLVEAVELYDERDFEGARAKVEQVLLDLPGHEEARFLLSQIEDATKGESQVSQFLQQARDALAAGDSQEAANFVMMAQALDPHHSGIAETIAEIERNGRVALDEAGFTPESDHAAFGDDAHGDGLFEPVGDPSDLFTEAAGHDVQPMEIGDTVDFEEAPPRTSPAAHPPPLHVSGARPDGHAAGPKAAPPGEEYYDDADVAEGLFETGSTMMVDDLDEVEVDPSDSHAVIRDLLSKGGKAAAGDDYAAAIDSWSRILLIDHTHEEALDRIEHIRHAKEGIDRRIEPMLTDARSAHVSGDIELAEDFVRRALELSPNNVEATCLKEAIERGAHPESAEADADSSMPDLEDDLFTDEFEAISDFGEKVPGRSTAVEGEWRTPAKPKRKIPWQWWAAGGAVGVVIVAAAMWIGGVFAPTPEAEPRIEVVNRVLTEARDMYNQKRVEEAIHYLEQNSADDQFQMRINKALEEYRKAVATPVPTPVPEGLSACREMLAEGRWMAAYDRVMAELKIHPNDPGLVEVRAQILEVEPLAANLFDSQKTGDFGTAIGIAAGLLETRPDDAEVTALYDRLLFNAGLAEMRAFNLTGAETHFLKLRDRLPEDDEVQRILEFVNTYKSRPVDMQLEIFVGSISQR